MTTTLYCPAPLTSVTSQGYVITQAGTAVPDNVVGAIIASAYNAGVVLTSSAGGTTFVQSGRSYTPGTGAPSGDSFPVGWELEDSTGATFVKKGDGTWSAAQSGTFAPLAAALAPRAKTPARRSVSLVADLGTSGHGFVASTGAATSNMNDTTDFARGAQSAQVTTKGDSSSVAGIRKTGIASMNLTGKKFEVTVEVSDWTRCKNVNLYVGDTSFANFYLLSLWDSNDAGGVTAIQPGGNGEWVTLTCDMSSVISTTGTPSLAAVTCLQVGFLDNGAAFTGHVNHIGTYAGSPVYPNGVVSLTFDDSFLSQWQIAQPRLERYGFAGTFYTIVDKIGTDSYYMTLSQLIAMQESGGHEVAAHAFTVANHNLTNGYADLSTSALHAEVAQLKQWMLINGFRGADHFAYPKGIYTPATQAVVRQYFSSARGTLKKPIGTPNPANVYRMQSFGCGYPQTSLAAAQTAIDNAYTNGSWQTLHFHDLVTTPPSPAGTSYVQWDIASFNSLMDYIATKGIPVRAVGDVLATV